MEIILFKESFPFNLLQFQRSKLSSGRYYEETHQMWAVRSKAYYTQSRYDYMFVVLHCLLINCEIL